MHNYLKNKYFKNKPIIMFSKATLKERRQYYREEWDPKDLPDFIATDIKKREFGFDHNGRGPNDRYKVFKGTESLRKFLRYKAPFAAYISVAFYNNPRRREDWLKAEYIFDVDAKEIIHRDGLDFDIVEDVFDIARDMGIHVQTYNDKFILIEEFSIILKK